MGGCSLMMFIKWYPRHNHLLENIHRNKLICLKVSSSAPPPLPQKLASSSKSKIWIPLELRYFLFLYIEFCAPLLHHRPPTNSAVYIWVYSYPKVLFHEHMVTIGSRLFIKEIQFSDWRHLRTTPKGMKEIILYI